MGGLGGRCLRRRSLLPDAALGLLSTGLLFAAPTPAVSLERLLAPPPSASYVADTEASGTPVGAFQAAEYADSVASGANPNLASALAQDGFAGGFGASWTDQASGRGLVELVVAFAGGRGARSWLGTAGTLARASENFKGSISVFGLGPYYGARYADVTVPSYADVISFVKGNNFFTVGYISSADDLGGAAPAQAKQQFAFAPADSIPPQLWPENLTLLSGGIDALTVAAGAALGIVILGFVTSMGLFLYFRRKGQGAADATLSLDGESQPPDG